MTSYEQRRGFTLVELLVVVAIIGILAGLIMVGGSAAFRAAREAATRMEMTNLERALEMYKTKYGEFPPDFSDYNAFERHFKKRWSRVPFSTYIPDCLGGSDCPSAAADQCDSSAPFDLHTHGVTIAINKALGTSFTYKAGDYTFDANLKLSAIAFWLGGLPDNDGTTLAGFGPSDDPLFITTPANKTIEKLREKPLYDFSTTLRNLPNDYTNEGYRCLISGKPVAYFRGTTLTTRDAKTRAYLQNPTVDYDPAAGNSSKHIEIKTGATLDDEVTPYALKIDPLPPAASAKIDWHNANSFQLIHPGADGVFSEGVHRDIADTSETQTGLTPGDLDNITNCGSSATIQGIIGK